MLRRNLRVLLCLVIIMVLCTGMISSFNLTGYAAAKTYYVATTGSDSYPGTVSQPFKTIQKAASVMTAGDTCYIAPGVYRETVTPTNSGRSGAPISFIAQGSGVVISAADLVTGWTLDSGNVYKASMNWTMNNSNPGCQAGMDQVFVDGKMMIEARWPNIPQGVDPCAYKREYGAQSDAGSYINKSYTKAGISSLPDPTGAYINEIAAAFWTPITGQVTSRTGDTIFFSRPDYQSGDDQYYGERDGDYFYLWGKKVLLDSAREWFRDSNGQLYLWSPNGDNPSNYMVEAKKRDNVLDLRGKSNLTFKGIGMRGGSILTDTNTKYLTLDDVDVQYSAHYSIVTAYWAARNYGVNLQGDYTVVKNSHFANSAETVLLVTGSNCTITNNVCHDACYLGANGYVLGINNSTGSEVSNNTCYGSGTNACLDIRYSPACIIKNNDLFYGSRMTCDGGMLMTCRDFDAQNTRVSNNFIHDGLGLSDESRYCFGTSGFYSEGGVHNYIIDHNILVGVGMVLGSPSDTPMTGWKVYNNTLVDSQINTSGDQILSNSQFTNNIFSYLYYTVDSMLNKNIITANWYTIPNNYNIADPLYVSRTNYDFRLQSNSPAIDTGAVIAPYTDGYVGSSPDIGALEYGKPAFVSGAVITDNDIANLNVTYDGVNTFSISGAPDGRYLPENFKLKVGNNSAGGTVTMNYRLKTWTVTGVTTTGGGQVYGQIGNNTPVAMNLTLGGGSTDTTYGFDDCSGGDTPVTGVHYGIDFGTNNWSCGNWFGMTKSGYFTTSGVTSKTFTIPSGKVLKSIKVSGDSGGTYTISSAGNTSKTGNISNYNPITVTTGWTNAASTITVNFSAGWASGIDDIVYGTAPTEADITYGFDDSAGGDTPVTGVHYGIDFGTNNWSCGNWFGMTKCGYFSTSGVTSKTFTIPSGKVLKSIKVSGENGGTYTISSAGNTSKTGNISNNTPTTVTTGWTTAAQTITVNFSAGWASGIDDIVYGTP